MIRFCLGCQMSKDHRVYHSHLAELRVSSKCFEHMNIAIVCPLPHCQAYRYLLTTMDRFSLSLKAVLLEEQTTNIIAKSLVST